MTPIEILQNRVATLEAKLALFEGSDAYIFQRRIQMLDGRNMTFGQTTGTKIGTSASEKIGFFGVTPAVQQITGNSPTNAFIAQFLETTGLTRRV